MKLGLTASEACRVLPELRVSKDGRDHEDLQEHQADRDLPDLLAIADWPDTPLRRWYESHEVILQKDLETQEGIREQAQKKR